jgi:uncharacterized protein YegL
MDDSGFVRPEAPQPRPLPVIVLADVSGSMKDDDKIGVLNLSMASMIRAFAAEDSAMGEICVGVVTFGEHGALLHQPLAPATDVRWTDLAATGQTPLGAALDLANELLHDDSVVVRRAYRPTLVLVSDGMPTDDWREPLNRLLASKRGGKAVRLAVGVGQDMDQDAFAVLDAFIANPLIRVGRADQVHELPRFFAWVTNSVSARIQSGAPDAADVMTPDDAVRYMS